MPPDTMIAPRKFTDREKAALCAICTLALVMRDCQRCAFHDAKAKNTPQIITIAAPAAQGYEYDAKTNLPTPNAGRRSETFVGQYPAGRMGGIHI